MESNDELKEINIKNCTCYYFDDIIKTKDFDLYNILIDEKSYKNVLVYNILYNILRIRFNKIDRIITNGITNIISIIMQKSKLIHTIICLQKNHWLVIIHIKSVQNKDENNYYFKIFLEKCLHQLPKNDSKL